MPTRNWAGIPEGPEFRSDHSESQVFLKELHHVGEN